jgi:phosphatidylinositol alpha-1,6-mannosyltransferase
MEFPPTLVITNDLPPRVGGAQQYTANLLSTFPPECLTVMAPAWPGWRRHDETVPYRVVRMPGRFLWPTRDVLERATALAHEAGVRAVLFTQGFPVTALGPSLAARGLPYVALTHGYEIWMALPPGLNRSMKYALSRASRVFAISDFTAARLQGVVPPGVPLSFANPCVDAERFRPDVDGAAFRAGLGLNGHKVIGCVSRFVRRKGQDILIEAMPELLRAVPEAILVLVGGGPFEPELRKLAAASPVRDRILFAGEVADHDLPSAYAASDVFAMPCRTRNLGFDFEGFGIVFLEAASTGLPVVAGRSGGAAEAVVDGETGLVVDGGDTPAVARAVTHLLRDEGLARSMGEAGRRRVLERFTWDRTGERVARALSDAAN